MKTKSVLLVLAVCVSVATATALAQQQDSGGGQAPQVPVINTGSNNAPSLDTMGVKKYLLGPGDVLDRLATSGGVTEAAGGDIQIFHTEPLMCPEPEDLAAVPVDSYKPTDPTQIGYDIFSVRDLKEGKKEANPVIRPGDIVIVQEAQPVYITGAVRSPQGL